MLGYYDLIQICQFDLCVGIIMNSKTIDKAWTKLLEIYQASTMRNKLYLLELFNGRHLQEHEYPDTWFMELELIRQRLSAEHSHDISDPEFQL